MKRSIAFRGVALATLVQFVAISCGGKQPPKKPGGGGGGGDALLQTGDAAPGLTLRLSDGKQGKPAADRSKLPPATPIPDSEAEAILSRLA